MREVDRSIASYRLLEPDSSGYKITRTDAFFQGTAFVCWSIYMPKLYILKMEFLMAVTSQNFHVVIIFSLSLKMARYRDSVTL